MKVKCFFRDNGLSLVLALLFLLFWSGQAMMGFKVHNHDSVLHGKPVSTFGEYLSSGHFWQATGENWESEFLQMGAYVWMTSFLFQRGSAESNDPDASGEEPLSSEEKPLTGIRAGWLYRNSLSIGFLLLFFMSFGIHAIGGLREFNDERRDHGESEATAGEFLGDPEFWFQSFQNWQSEFLAVLSIVVLTIFLRQQGSPESKAVGDPNSKTGG